MVNSENFVKMKVSNFIAFLKILKMYENNFWKCSTLASEI